MGGLVWHGRILTSRKDTVQHSTPIQLYCTSVQQSLVIYLLNFLLKFLYNYY